MNEINQILIPLSVVLYMLISCVFDAFEDLSGGRVRKIEEKNPELAEKLDSWLEKDDQIRMLFKLLLFVIASVFSISVYCSTIHLKSLFGLEIPYLGVILLAVSIVLLCSVSDLLAKLLLPRGDLLIISVTIPLMLVFSRVILAPLAPLFRLLNKKMKKIMEDAPEPEDKASLEDEILDMMEDEPDGQLEEGEKRMIRGIFDLQDMAVKEIMTPRVDVVAIPLSSSIEEAKQIFVASGHSRIPVYGRSIDEIRGIIYAKDFLAIPQDKKSLAGMIHTPIFIPETKAVDELLEEIKRTRNHFAVIIDEYGGTSGIVTFEDIIEEIVGDVRDEYDSAEDAVEKPQLLPDGSVLLEARTPVSDVNEILDIDIPDSEHADTIGGYICAELGRIPEQGETYTAPGLFRAEIVKADKRKIQKLKLTVPENEDE